MRIRSRVDAMAVAALGLLALAAVAGGNNANFTATTANPSNVFTTATLSLTNDKSTAGSLVSLSNMVPGDMANRTVIVTNTGNVGFTFTGNATPLTTTVLWTDIVKGLQVSVKRGLTVLYTGALKDLALPASPTIAPAATDTLTLDFSLPTSADNTFQGLTQTFTVTYTATQLAGTAR
jgi:hypothetical protein